jgi:hypothetical protein
MPLNFAGHFFVGLRGDDFKTFVAILTARFEVAFSISAIFGNQWQFWQSLSADHADAGIPPKHFA